MLPCASLSFDGNTLSCAGHRHNVTSTDSQAAQLNPFIAEPHIMLSQLYTKQGVRLCYISIHP